MTAALRVHPCLSLSFALYHTFVRLFPWLSPGLATDMAFSSRLPGACIILLYLQFVCTAVLAQGETEVLPGFGDTVQVLGAVSYLTGYMPPEF
jgi:hypothetical protein